MWGVDPQLAHDSHKDGEKEYLRTSRDWRDQQEFHKPQSRAWQSKLLSGDQRINTIPEVTEEDCSILLSKYNIEKGGFDVLKSRDRLTVVEDPRAGLLEDIEVQVQSKK
jgi:hypothetical protein